MPAGQLVGSCGAGFARMASSCLNTVEFVAEDGLGNVDAAAAEDGFADAALACLALSSALKRASRSAANFAARFCSVLALRAARALEVDLEGELRKSLLPKLPPELPPEDDWAKDGVAENANPAAAMVIRAMRFILSLQFVFWPICFWPIYLSGALFHSCAPSQTHSSRSCRHNRVMRAARRQADAAYKSNIFKTGRPNALSKSN